jgi:hypothetical protein
MDMERTMSPTGFVSRRGFLASAGMAGAALAAPLDAAGYQERVGPVPAPPAGSPARAAADEAHWQRIASYYRVTDRVTNLEAAVGELLDRYRLFTVRRNGLERGDCVRVTPALYNSADDVDRLAAALKQLAAA